jgi:hypothetical protein
MIDFGIAFFNFNAFERNIRQWEKAYRREGPPDYDAFMDAEEATEFVRSLRSGIVVFHLRKKKELPELVRLLKSIYPLVKKKQVKVFGVYEGQNKKVRQLLVKLKVEDFLEVSDINPKTFKFKVDLWKRTIQRALNTDEDTDYNKKRSDKQSGFLTSSTRDVIKEDPIDIPEDQWIIKSVDDCKFFMLHWSIKMMGPSPYAGRWEDSEKRYKNSTIWVWTISDKAPEEFQGYEGLWYLIGEKPDYLWDEDRWLFKGKAELKLTYYDNEKNVSRFFVKGGDLHVSKNSKSALRKESAIIETFENNLETSEELLRDTKKEFEDDTDVKELQARQEGQNYDGTLAGDIADKDDMGGNYDGKNKTEHQGGGPAGSIEDDEGLKGFDDLEGFLNRGDEDGEENDHSGETDDLGGPLKGMMEGEDGEADDEEGELSPEEMLGGPLAGKTEKAADRHKGHYSNKQEGIDVEDDTDDPEMSIEEQLDHDLKGLTEKAADRHKGHYSNKQDGIDVEDESDDAEIEHEGDIGAALKGRTSQAAEDHGGHYDNEHEGGIDVEDESGVAAADADDPDMKGAIDDEEALEGFLKGRVGAQSARKQVEEDEEGISIDVENQESQEANEDPENPDLHADLHFDLQGKADAEGEGEVDEEGISIDVENKTRGESGDDEEGIHLDIEDHTRSQAETDNEERGVIGANLSQNFDIDVEDDSQADSADLSSLYSRKAENGDVVDGDEQLDEFGEQIKGRRKTGKLGDEEAIDLEIEDETLVDYRKKRDAEGYLDSDEVTDFSNFKKERQEQVEGDLDYTPGAQGVSAKIEEDDGVYNPILEHREANAKKYLDTNEEEEEQEKLASDEIVIDGVRINTASSKLDIEIIQIDDNDPDGIERSYQVEFDSIFEGECVVIAPKELIKDEGYKHRTKLTLTYKGKTTVLELDLTHILIEPKRDGRDVISFKVNDFNEKRMNKFLEPHFERQENIQNFMKYATGRE